MRRDAIRRPRPPAANAGRERQVIYHSVIRPILFQIEPEVSHEAALALLAAAGPVVSRFGAAAVRDPRLETAVCGITFPSPVGLAGGFDKAARALSAWPSFGFGFVEVGTVTARPQPGNPRPRLFRLSEDDALINRLGFNSPGADVVAGRLAALRRRPYPIPLGVNIGRSRAASNDEAPDDYAYSFDRLHRFADFVVVNLSSPNTPGLRSLQTRAALVPLLDRLAERNRALGEKPMFVKVAPDLTDEELAVIAAATDGRAHGLVATNTTIHRNALRSAARDEAGGLSGRPLRDLNTRVIRTLFQLTRGRVPIIGVGGIFSASDAYEKIKAGAALVELYTGFVYGGPGTPRRILAGLRDLLTRDGFENIASAVGIEAG
jgi:dihydroorotate dehydrogenase